MEIPDPTDVPDIAFDDLLQELKDEGFSLSLHDYVEFVAIFKQYTGDKKNFKYYLAPIVCRNKEEQEKFYRIYNQHHVAPVDRRMKEAARGFQQQFRLFRNFYFRLFLFLFLSGGGKAILLLLKRKERDLPVVVAPSTPVVPDSAVAMPLSSKHRPVFVARPMKHPTVDSSEERTVIVPRGKPIEKENTVHSTAFAWLLVSGMTCLILSASFFPQRKSKFLPEVDLDTRHGDGLSLDIPFLPKNHLIQKLPVMARVAGDLRRPVPTGVYQLDIQKTIRESIRYYGLLSPVYNDIERKPEYLAVIDRSSELSFNLARYILRLFSDDRVNINCYYYEDEWIFYPDGETGPVNLYGLWERHGNARLIMMHEDDDLPVEFSQWGDRLIMTELLGDRPKSGFVSIKEIGDLREYLGDEDIFQWVCALAVYPSVKWEVLIAVGAAILEERKVLDKLNFTNLLTITRIGWLRGVAIPAAVRIELLKALDLRTEIRARKAILDLLKEADGIITTDSSAFQEMLLQRYTQSFVLYGNDVKNKQYEEDAKKFISLWNKRRVPDMATVIYLKNQNKDWETPLRSTDNASKSVGAERFMNELLALRVISDPGIRAFFRNAALVCFMVMLLLFLFKDNIEGLGINKVLGFIERDYRDNAITVIIPVNDCLRKQANNGKLRVTLNNYDNNRYTQTYSIVDQDSLRVRFEDITMAGKAPEKATFTLILDKDFTIDCPYKEFYSQYVLLLRGGDCLASQYKPGPPNYYLRQGHMDQQ